MIGYLLVGAAAAVDGFGAGVWAGRKWAKKVVKTVKADVAKEAPAVAAVEQKVVGAANAAEAAVPAVLTPEALEAHVKALVEKAKASA